jgi:hypothetical protein
MKNNIINNATNIVNKYLKINPSDNVEIFMLDIYKSIDIPLGPKNSKRPRSIF